jgi:hypothetical protein
MSRINGDKSRASIAHKRGVHRREKIKQLLEARKNPSTATTAAASGAPRPATGKSR